MPAFVLAMQDREFLETPVFHAGPTSEEEAVAVFSSPEAANRYLEDAEWSDHEVGALNSLQLLRWLTRAQEQGTRFLVVNPDRQKQLAGKKQMSVMIEEELDKVAAALTRNILGTTVA